MDYITRHKTQQNNKQGLQQGLVLRMRVISKIPKEILRRKTSVGPGVKAKPCILGPLNTFRSF